MVWNERRERESNFVQQILNQGSQLLILLMEYIEKWMVGGGGYFYVSEWVNIWWYVKEMIEKLSDFWP